MRLVASEEGYPVGVVFFHSSCNGQNIRIKDDVIGIEISLAHEKIIRSRAYLNFAFRGSCLGGGEGEREESSNVRKQQHCKLEDLHASRKRSSQ